MLGTPLRGPVSRGRRDRRLRHGLLLGRRADLLGSRPACTPPRSATPAASRPTPPTRRSAAGAPATPRSCSSPSTPPRRATTDMLRLFWEGHDPTQGMRQGNDVGTQYRSLIMWQRRGPASRRRRLARRLPADAQRRPAMARSPPSSPSSTTRTPFYYAEDYHQQYLAKNPGGYCGLGGTGVACPVGLSVTATTAAEHSPSSTRARGVCHGRRIAVRTTARRAPGTGARMATDGPAEAGPSTVLNPSAGASVGRPRPRREKCLPPITLPRPRAACRPGLPRRRVRAAQRRHVRRVDLVAVDRVIADLQLLVGEPQRYEDADHLQDDERGHRRVRDHPCGCLRLPAQQRPATAEQHSRPRPAGWSRHRPRRCTRRSPDRRAARPAGLRTARRYRG